MILLVIVLFPSFADVVETAEFADAKAAEKPARPAIPEAPIRTFRRVRLAFSVEALMLIVVFPLVLSGCFYFEGVRFGVSVSAARLVALIPSGA
ncbi:hypothetical protein OIU34_29475 [Pararhizobium sp. BT-229]|uniref:hypothetical protein n=1 Tax=Pararhizobium sp. BT-229 TaxID=2986923 RepID=UPI0021F6CF13|nr:hypothetical protein [Pararhizobium sp. BT-229]MCV9966005.1 hypothetical protein [Pararhizobium sp. BT-229]